MFPLQCCDWDVDAVHTTDYLNHPGHGTFQGTKYDAQSIAEVLNGLRKLFDLGTYYNVVLIGYCPNAEMMKAVYNELLPIYSNSSMENRPVFVVDPVLGDNGRLYVPKEVVQVHVGFLKLGYVDLTTPNQFEMEILTGISMKSWEDVKRAAHLFYERYNVRNFAILSVVIGASMYSVGFCADSDEIFYVPIEEIKCRFSGCGDIFTALLTDNFYANGRVLSPETLKTVVRKLHQILVRSYKEEEEKTGYCPEVVNDINLVRLRDIFEKIN